MNDGIVTDFLFSKSANWETVRDVNLIHNAQNIARAAHLLPCSSLLKKVHVQPSALIYPPRCNQKTRRYQAALSACHDSLLTLCQYALVSNIKGANVHASSRQVKGILHFPFSGNLRNICCWSWKALKRSFSKKVQASQSIGLSNMSCQDIRNILKAMTHKNMRTT